MRITSDSHRDHVVKCALEYRTQASPEARRLLEEMIERYVPRRGHRTSLGLPPVTLHSSVKRELARHPDLHDAIVLVWSEAHRDLRNAMFDYVSALPGATIEQIHSSDSHDAHPFNQAVEGFVIQHPAFDEEDIRQMLSFAVNVAAAGNLIVGEPPAEAKESAGLSPDRVTPLPLPATLKDIIDQLHVLDAHDPAWQRVPELLVAIQTLADEKDAERQQGRNVLRAALDTLRERVPERLLMFFEIGQAVNWSAERCAIDDLENATRTVERLTEDLITYAALESAPRTRTVHERRARREQIDAAERTILGTIDQLDLLLGADAAPEPPDEPGDEREPLDEPAPELTDQRGAEGEPTTVDEPAEPVATSEPPDPPAAEHDTLAVAPAPAQAPVAAEPPSPSPSDSAPLSTAPTTTAETTDVTEDLAATPEPVPFITLPTPAQTAPLPAAEPDITPAPEPALTLPPSDVDDWYEFAMQLVVADDVPGAWWIVRWLEESGGSTSIPAGDRLPAWLLGAAWAASRLAGDPERFVPDLLSTVQERSLDPASDVQALVGLATALVPALVAPHTSLHGWLDAPWQRMRRDYPGLTALADAAVAAANQGFVLRTDLLDDVVSREALERRITDAAADAADWLERAPSRKLPYQPATILWQLMTREHGVVAELLAPVIHDQRERVAEVDATIREWSDPKNEEHLIQTNYHRHVLARNPGAKDTIAYKARTELSQLLAAAREKAGAWVALVNEGLRAAEYGTGWHRERIQELRDAVTRARPAVEAEIAALRQLGQPPAQVAAGAVLRRAVGQFDGLLGFVSIDPSPTHWDHLLQDAATLEGGLRHRLVWLPEVRLRERMPAGDEFATIARRLRAAHGERRTLRAAFDGWLASYDYRFGRVLLRALADDPTIETLQARYREELDGARAALERRLADLVQQVEFAMLAGALTDDERANLKNELDRIEPASALDMRGLHEQLDAVEHELAAARTTHGERQRGRWHTLRSQLFEAGRPHDTIDQVDRRIEQALAAGSLRVAEEYLASAERYLIDERADPAQRPTEQVPDDLERFMALAPALYTALQPRLGVAGPRGIALRDIAADVSNRKRTSIGLDFSHLRAENREEAHETIIDWLGLKQRTDLPEAEKLMRVRTILRFLGFTVEGGKPFSVVATRPGEWMHLLVTMTAGELARPIPQFGSLAEGKYHVVCLWGQQNALALSRLIDQLNLAAQPVIVLALSALSADERRNVAAMAHQKHRELALLDELVLLTLAQEHNNRLPAFLRIALPFAYVNPYRATGPVPPEMFFGRDHLIGDLQRPGGPNIVYGARQVGKTALLRAVQQAFHQPDRQQYALYIDLRASFDPNRGPESVWYLLRDRLRDLGLVKATFSRPDSIVNAIKTAVLDDPRRRVIVMLDEADDLLDADERNRFQEVARLRSLMYDTNQRFRVIFAGLHSVQRFQSAPNQPLAQFGQPVRIAALEPAAAWNLVRAPIETLGYRFEDPDDLILRILSYTNYHPGLIQLFCHALLEQLADGFPRAPKLPCPVPVSITDAVFADDSVRRGIRERFGWTLALDRRYEVIAWSMIVEPQPDDDRSMYRSTPQELLDTCRRWWPQGFATTTLPTMKVLLDELTDLNVLQQDANGRYTLRNRNVAQLVGDEGTIETRLLSMESQPAPVKPDASTWRAPLTKSSDPLRPLTADDLRHFSPLTGEDLRAVAPLSSGVAAVLASPALGWSQLPDAFRLWAPDESRDELLDWLASLDRQPDASRVTARLEEISAERNQVMAITRITTQRATIAPELLASTTALTSRRQRARDRWLRLVLLLDPAAAHSWFVHRAAEHERDQAVPLLSPRLWDAVGVQQRLELLEIDASTERCARVLEATGGWPLLLDEFLARYQASIDAAAVDRFRAELAAPDSALHATFVEGLGLAADPVAHRILDTLIALGDEPVEPAFIDPALLGEPAIDPDDLRISIVLLEQLRCLRTTREGFVVDPIVRLSLEAE